MTTYLVSTDWPWLSSVNKRGLKTLNPRQVSKSHVILLPHPKEIKWAFPYQPLQETLGKWALTSREISQHCTGPFTEQELIDQGWVFHYLNV